MASQWILRLECKATNKKDLAKHVATVFKSLIDDTRSYHTRDIKYHVKSMNISEAQFDFFKHV